jgi:hypothetical protein
LYARLERNGQAAKPWLYMGFVEGRANRGKTPMELFCKPGCTSYNCRPLTQEIPAAPGFLIPHKPATHIRQVN